MSRLPDPIREGLARGWKVYGGPHAEVPRELRCDVAIVGTGAGGGITAELLARAGLDVVLVEEGPLKSSADFRQRESDAYPSLYQECAAQKSADRSIGILQGRCVGGSTTVNWTSSFRTPPATLRHWRERHGLDGMTGDVLDPWFAQAERRLSIARWPLPPNRNNDVLRRGAEVLGIPAGVVARNVRACWDLGSCGMGCPTNAKQSMLVTTIPVALDHGARLLSGTRARALQLVDGRVRSLLCDVLGGDGQSQTGARTSIVARHYVVAAGAIRSPALLMRSGIPDPQDRLGTRTFLHPVVLSAATFEQPVEGWSGAPQSVYTDHFLDMHALEGPMGYKIEAPPLHPVIFASTVPGFGAEQAAALARFPQTQVLIALLRDGFHRDSPGGVVRLRPDGSPVLDYPLNDYVMDGARRAFLSMAELQFAAGAQTVQPVHEEARPATNWLQARAAIGQLAMKPLLTRMVSAHVMGGCAMAATERDGVVRPDGVHWHVSNLSVHDGSLFPTSVGANPQLSIYAIVARLATELAARLGGRAVTLA